MKKTVLISVLSVALLFAGCGETASAPKGQSNGNTVSNVIAQQMANATAEVATAEVPKMSADTMAVQTVATQEVDVDLTALSSTMVYSEVYGMVNTPEEYLGKIVRMEGQFGLYQAVDEEGNPIPSQIYYACLIADATSCCSQGIEFVPINRTNYPDDFPPLGSDICVVGRFETYMEDGYRYCHLVDAVMN